MPLLYLWEYLTMLVIIVAHSVQRWVRLLMGFYPVKMRHSSTMKANQNGGNFLVNSKLIYPCPVTNLCGVFSNRVLSLTSNGEPRAITVVCIVLAVFTTPLNVQPEGTCPTPGTRHFAWQLQPSQIILVL